MGKSNNVLNDLQDVLVQIYNIDKEISAIPSEIEEKTDVCNRAKAKHLDTLEKLKKVKTSIAEGKSALAEIKEKREAAELKLEKVTTQREFDSENAVVDKCKSEEHRLRINVQNQEKLRDRLAQNEKDEDKSLSELEENTSATIAELEAKQETLKKNMDKLNARKKKLTEKLDNPELLVKIERIIKNKGTIASVALKSGVCQGCYMQLPDQFVNRVHENKEVMFCPYCSRILNYEESAEDAEIIDSNLKYNSGRQDDSVKDDDADEMLDEGDPDADIAVNDEEDNIGMLEDGDYGDDEDDDRNSGSNVIADESEFDL